MAYVLQRKLLLVCKYNRDFFWVKVIVYDHFWYLLYKICFFYSVIVPYFSHHSNLNDKYGKFLTQQDSFHLRTISPLRWSLFWFISKVYLLQKLTRTLQFVCSFLNLEMKMPSSYVWCQISWIPNCLCKACVTFIYMLAEVNFRYLAYL